MRAEWWLPPGVTWKDMENFENDGHQIAHASDLYWIPVYAIALIPIRILFEKIIGHPTAALLGVKVRLNFRHF